MLQNVVFLLLFLIQMRLDVSLLQNGTILCVRGEFMSFNFTFKGFLVFQWKMFLIQNEILQLSSASWGCPTIVGQQVSCSLRKLCISTVSFILCAYAPGKFCKYSSLTRVWKRELQNFSCLVSAVVALGKAFTPGLLILTSNLHIVQNSWAFQLNCFIMA